MTEQERITIERACERLVVDFAFFSDHREYEALGALFAEHGSMTRPSGNVLIGRDAIVQAYQATPSERITRHVCTNTRIRVDSNDRATGWTYATVYSNDKAPRIGEFEDEFLKTSEGWRIAGRTARFIFGE